MKVVNDYIGNIIYQNSSLKQIQTSEGYCQEGVYYYYLKDHLGNNRYVINGSGTKIETSHYYPFGMRFYIGSTTNSSAIGFRYNAKEFDAMNGLYCYDYGARFYDPQIGRFHSIDPMAPFAPGISPYTDAYDDPINNIDYFGLGPFTWLWKVIVWIVNDPTRATYSTIHDKVIWHSHSRVKTSPPHEKSTANVPNNKTIPSLTIVPPSQIITPPKLEIGPIIPPMIQGNSPFAGQKPEITGHITFKIQSADIDFQNEANAEFLNKIVETLIEYPQIIIEIKSNTSDSNDKQDDQSLFRTSMARSRAIIKYLKSKGVLNKLIATPGVHNKGGDAERTTSFKIFNDN